MLITTNPSRPLPTRVAATPAQTYPVCLTTAPQDSVTLSGAAAEKPGLTWRTPVLAAAAGATAGLAMAHLAGFGVNGAAAGIAAAIGATGGGAVFGLIGGGLTTHGNSGSFAVGALGGGSLGVFLGGMVGYGVGHELVSHLSPALAGLAPAVLGAVGGVGLVGGFAALRGLLHESSR